MHRCRVEVGKIGTSRVRWSGYLCRPSANLRWRGTGEVPEWSIGSVSKTDVPARVPGVRIPPSPPRAARATLWPGFFVPTEPSAACARSERKSPVSAERSRAILEALLKGKARLAQSLFHGSVRRSSVSAERSRAILEALLKGKARLAQSLFHGSVRRSSVSAERSRAVLEAFLNGKARFARSRCPCFVSRKRGEHRVITGRAWWLPQGDRVLRAIQAQHGEIRP